MRAESDAEIVQNTLAGNRGAFETLVLRYNRMAYAVAFARLGNHPDTEDAVQESWLQAFRTLDRLRDPARFPAWLAAIVRNVSVNAARNRWRSQPLEEAGGMLMVDYRKPMEDADVQRTLWAHVEAMTPEHREVLTLHYHAGMTTDAIAAASGVPREAIKKRLQRARATLSEQTLQMLFEPAEKEEENRRKRVMALVLTAPIPWPSSAGSPLRQSPPALPLWLGPLARTSGINLRWLLAGTLIVGAALLSFVVFWLTSPQSASTTPTAIPPTTASTTFEVNVSGGKGDAPATPGPGLKSKSGK